MRLFTSAARKQLPSNIFSLALSHIFRWSNLRASFVGSLASREFSDTKPVSVDGKDRDQVITQDYHLLRDDLAAMLPDRSITITLVKENVCRLLNPSLSDNCP